MSLLLQENKTSKKESVPKGQNDSPQDSKRKVPEIPTLSSLMYLVRDKTKLPDEPINMESINVDTKSKVGSFRKFSLQ